MNQGSLDLPYELKRESNKTMKDEEDSIAEKLDQLSKKLAKIEGQIENNKKWLWTVAIIVFGTQLTQFFGLLSKLKF